MSLCSACHSLKLFPVESQVVALCAFADGKVLKTHVQVEGGELRAVEEQAHEMASRWAA